MLNLSSLKWVSRLLGGMAVAGLMTFVATAALADEEKVLNIYNWSDYIAEDTIANFEKETGIKVRYDTFDSNETLHAKMVAGKTGYDIVVPSSNWGKVQGEGGLLMKLDKSKITTYGNLDPFVMDQLKKMDPGNQYLAPWLWGVTTVGINVNKLKAALGNLPLPENAWDLIFKPEYASKAKRLGLLHQDVAPALLGSAMEQLIRQILTNGPAAMAATKQMVKEISSQPLDAGLISNLIQRSIEIRHSPEGREGIDAFIEHRTPDWFT